MADITSNLIGHWPLNGDRFAEVGSNLTGFVGTVTYTEEASGPPWPQVAVFNGSSALDTSGYFPALASTEELTYSCWFYKTSGSTATLLGNDDNSATGGLSVFITGAEIIRLRTYSGTIASDMGSVSLNTWQHLVVTKSSGGSGVADFRTFLNGSLLATETNPTYSWNTSERFYVGCRTNSGDGASAVFTGRMSDVRVYNRQLSADDVAELYAWTPPSGDGLLEAVRPAVRGAVRAAVRSTI